MGCVAYLKVSEVNGALVVEVPAKAENNEGKSTEGERNASSAANNLAGDIETVGDGNGPLQAAVSDERGAGDEGVGRGGRSASGVSGDRSVVEGEQSDNGVDSEAVGSGSASAEEGAAGGVERGGGDKAGAAGRSDDGAAGAAGSESAVSEVGEDAAKPGAKVKTAEAEKGAESGLSLAEKLVLQKQAEAIEHKANDLDNIRETLPVLLPEQQDDVKFAEERFSDPNGFGMLFTNGTGTGKTFTGLGVAKRFHRQGKKNILIVVPSDKIARDWVSSAGYFDMPAKQLAGTKDNGGEGVVVTTYAAFGNNPTLLAREWDLVIPDEAHKLNQNAAGKDTIAQRMLNEATNKNIDNRYSWKHYAPDLAKWMKLQQDVDKAMKVKDAKYPHFSDYFKAIFTGSRVDGLPELKMGVFDKRHKALVAKAEARAAKLMKAKKSPKRGRVVFLSATPFAYHKSLKYADGYLFDSDVTEDKSRVGAYNHAQGFDSFLQAKFGYQMKTGKLNRPDVEVDTSLAERNLNTELQKSGVLRGRRLVVDVDYSREFVLIDDGIGKKIDEGMRWLSDKRDDYPGLSAQLQERFDYLARLQLLEAIKVKHAIARADKHIKLGRKVVMFHSFKQGGGFVHPFKFKETPDVSRDAIERFNAERPDLVGLPLDGLPSPIDRIKAKYGARAALFNGDVPKAKRNQAVQDFNDDAGSVDVILVQTDAGKEGISLHDTTGKYQRVLINLGLPTKPTDAIQIEGRTYRTGVKTNSIKEYLTTGLDYETHAFASAVARRSSTAENLALGHEGRNLLKAFVNAYNAASASEPSLQQGTGGKALDYDASESTQMDQAKLAFHTRQKNNKRRSEREGKDYYATPEPVGLKMVEWLGLKPGEHGAETSAGHGAIARWFPDHSKNTFVEQSYSLAGDLGMLGNGEVKQTDFMTFRPSRNFDGVALNPPYGSGGSDAVKHSAKAFSHLRPGGRMVTLIPDGGATDTKFDKWYESDAARDAHIVATIKLPAVTFKKAGTGVRTKLVIIDRVPAKWIKEGAEVSQHRQLDLSHHEKLTDLFDELDEVGIADRAVEPKPDLKLSKAKLSIDEKIALESGVLNELRESFPAIDKLVMTGKVSIKSSSTGFPDAMGIYDDKADKVYLFANHIPKGEAYSVFLHEAGEHAGLEAMLGAEKYAQVNKQFDRLLKSKNVDAVRAAEAVPGNTPSEHVASERLAYFVQDFTQNQPKTGGAKMLAQRVLAAVRVWAMKALPKWVTRGIRLGPADIQALAMRAAKGWADGSVVAGNAAGGVKLSSKDKKTAKAANRADRDAEAKATADWSEVDRALPKEGMERTKELFSKSGEWIKNNATEFSKNGMNGLLTLRQLIENAGEHLPSATRYMSQVDKMLTDRNQMQEESAKLAQRWLNLDKVIKHRLAHVMHEATRNGTDPSAKSFEPQAVERFAEAWVM